MNVLAVGELTDYLRELFESDPILRDLWVRGEVSNFSRSAAGHCYFTLKDGDSQVRCVLFRGGPKTHGQSDRWRAPGSIGATSTPGRVFKGQRMAGHTGHERVTVQNLEVVRIDADRNLVLVKGSVPGPNEGLLLIRKAIKGPGRTSRTTPVGAAR